MNKKAIIIGIVIAIIAIPVGIYTLLPLFVNTTINEPVPITSRGDSDDAAIQEFEEFMAMSEEERMEKGQEMSVEERDVIMEGAAQSDDVMVDEDTTETMSTSGQPSTTYTGAFVGVDDGIHNAEGQVLVIQLDDGSSILRLEDFKSTNGPDLYVYLSTDRDASDFVNLGRLKGNMGNQNYEVPGGTDFSKYDTALIWCQAFSVLFGSAELDPSNSP